MANLSNLTFVRSDFLRFLQTDGIKLPADFQPENWQDVVDYFRTHAPQLGRKAEPLRQAIFKAATQLAIDWDRDTKITHGVAEALGVSNIFDLAPSKEALEAMFEKADTMPQGQRIADFLDREIVGKEVEQKDDDDFELDDDLNIEVNLNPPSASVTWKAPLNSYADAVDALKTANESLRAEIFTVLQEGAEKDGWREKFDKTYESVRRGFSARR